MSRPDDFRFVWVQGSVHLARHPERDVTVCGLDCVGLWPFFHDAPDYRRVCSTCDAVLVEEDLGMIDGRLVPAAVAADPYRRPRWLHVVPENPEQVPAAGTAEGATPSRPGPAGASKTF